MSRLYRLKRFLKKVFCCAQHVQILTEYEPNEFGDDDLLGAFLLIAPSDALEASGYVPPGGFGWIDVEEESDEEDEEDEELEEFSDEEMIETELLHKENNNQGNYHYHYHSYDRYQFLSATIIVK